jgi:hypothetical protein
MMPILPGGRWLAWFFALLLVSGCSGPHLGAAPNPTQSRLLKIGEAYRRATYRLGHPPANFEELKPSLLDAKDEELRSPNDGEHFVIIYGVDYDKLPVPADKKSAIGAYEKKGAGDKRYVLRISPRPFALATDLLSDEQWKHAVFPPGYTPPSL